MSELPKTFPRCGWRMDRACCSASRRRLKSCDVSAQDGKVAWRAKIDEAFSQPISVGDDVYVSTDSGRLIALDADSGDPKWATQIPQPLETGPGIDDRANRAYVPGNHSNLYLLNTRDGSCLESFYIGHEDGNDHRSTGPAARSCVCDRKRR